MKHGRSRHKPALALVAEPLGPRSLPPCNPEMGARLRMQYKTELQALAESRSWPGLSGPDVSSGPLTREGEILAIAQSLRQSSIGETPSHFADEAPPATGIEQPMLATVGAPVPAPRSGSPKRRPGIMTTGT